jgi:hypothetical protein
MHRESAHHAAGGLKPGLKSLRPVIKSTQFLETLRKQTHAAEGALPLAATRFIGDLWILYVWDRPNGMQFVTSSEPAEFGLTLEQTHIRALANYLESPRNIETHMDGGVVVARTRDNYDASLLLDDQFWTDIQKKIPGTLLALTTLEPSADGNSGGEARLMALIQQHMSRGDHLISTTILKRTRNVWQIHTPAAKSLPAAQHPAQPSARPAPAKKPWWKFW